MKIGERELEIIEYLQEKGKETYVQLLVMFSPTIRSPKGKAYRQFNTVEDRLLRMREKGLIAIEDDGLRTVRLTVSTSD